MNALIRCGVRSKTMFKDRIKKWLGLESRANFYIALSLVLLFYIAGFVYMSMFVHSYENDLNVDFVVFTMEHYYIILIVIVILPMLFGLFIAGLLQSHCWTFEQEAGLLALVFFGGIFYTMVMTFFFCFGSPIKMNQTDYNYITKEQRGIIVDLVKQEKISKQIVKAKFYNDWVEKEGSGREIGKVMDINRVPLEFYVCFEKGFNNPICAKLFENFLIKEKEKVRREKAREYLAEKNKIESIENYNRILKKVK